jgi:hypothetical protein
MTWKPATIPGGQRNATIRYTYVLELPAGRYHQPTNQPSVLARTSPCGGKPLGSKWRLETCNDSWPTEPRLPHTRSNFKFRIAKNQSNLPKPHQRDKKTDSFSPIIWYLHPLGRIRTCANVPPVRPCAGPTRRPWEPANVLRRACANVLELPAGRYHQPTNQPSRRAGSHITLWG